MKSKMMKLFHKKIETGKERKRNRKNQGKEAHPVIQIDYELKHLSLYFYHLSERRRKRIKDLNDIPRTLYPYHSIPVFFNQFIIFYRFYLFFTNI